MKKIFFSIVAIGFIAIAQAQETPSDTITYWKSKGNASLLFNQSNFSNWTGGGENNLSGNFGLNYGLEYAKDHWTWDNKLMASYGIVKTKNASFEKKTDDRLEFNSVLGKKATGKWSYSAFLNFRTQITKGYIYGKDANGMEIRTESTDFISPGYLTFGPGMLYKKDENFKINLAPATSKLTFVDNYYTSFGQTSDFQTIGRELQVLSTEHFSTDDYYMSSGQYLKNEDMDKLLRRSSNTKE